MFLFKLAVGAGLASFTAGQVVNSTTCNGKNYTYQALAGFGLIPGNARDEFRDDIVGIGSGIAFDRYQWKRLPNGSYTGVFWGLPDRGWSVERFPTPIISCKGLFSNFILRSLIIKENDRYQTS